MAEQRKEIPNNWSQKDRVGELKCRAMYGLKRYLGESDTLYVIRMFQILQDIDDRCNYGRQVE